MHGVRRLFRSISFIFHRVQTLAINIGTEKHRKLKLKCHFFCPAALVALVYKRPCEALSFWFDLIPSAMATQLLLNSATFFVFAVQKVTGTHVHSFWWWWRWRQTYIQVERAEKKRQISPQCRRFRLKTNSVRFQKAAKINVYTTIRRMMAINLMLQQQKNQQQQCQTKGLVSNFSIRHLAWVDLFGTTLCRCVSCHVQSGENGYLENVMIIYKIDFSALTQENRLAIALWFHQFPNLIQHNFQRVNCQHQKVWTCKVFSGRTRKKKTVRMITATFLMCQSQKNFY